MYSSAFYRRWREALEGAEGGYREQLERLESRYAGALEREESRLFEHLEELVDASGRALAARFSRLMDDIEAEVGARAAPAPSLDSLDVATLHLLARLDSALRHSIVEACLMNLRSLAGVLDERMADAEFAAKVEVQLGLVPGALQQIVDFFKRPVAFGVCIRDLLAMPYKAAIGAMDGLLASLRAFKKRREGASEAPVKGRELAAQIDALMRALGDVRRLLDERKASLARAARSGMDVLRPTLERHGVEITFIDETDGDDRLYLDPSGVANAVAELVRNALRHGVVDGTRGEWIVVRVQAEPLPGTELRVCVEHPGRTPPPAVLKGAGRRALSTSGGGAGLTLVRGVAEAHFGRLELEARSEGGARASLVFPRHMPRPAARAAGM